MPRAHLLSGSALLIAFTVGAQDSPRYGRDKFRQLDQELPTPNEQRTASGAPGHAYWQMKADYNISVEIDETTGPTPKLTGKETITYHNQSPDKLDYLWLQLDQNIFEPGSDSEPNWTRIPEQTGQSARSDAGFSGFTLLMS